jgi:tRNA-dihydrouridine synthase A
MLGREVYSNPYLLAEVDRTFYGASDPVSTREQVIAEFMHYCSEQIAKGVKLSHMSRHILGLYQGLPGARRFRRVISERAHRADAGIEVLQDALMAMTTPSEIHT